MEKLKASKTKIVLSDGRELQYHVPPRREDLSHAKPSKLSFVPGQILEVEIGPGKGEFIAARSKNFPERFFLGIDRRDDRTELTEKKLLKTGVENWTILNDDARSVLEVLTKGNFFPQIEILHVYHPDPWPKKRHFKNRFFRSPDAKNWARALRPGGELRVSTDHAGYFEEILDIIESWKFLKLGLVLQKTAAMGPPQSHFESIFLRRNEPVYKAVFIKEDNQAVLLGATGFKIADTSASLAF